MDGYKQISLLRMVDALGEDEIRTILSSFSCPLNADVDNFLKAKAIEFAKQGISQTHLVFCSYKAVPVLVGYYTLANKTISVKKKALSNTYCSKISKHSRFDASTRSYILSAPLIAQLGKNYSDNMDKLISGDELLKMACEKIAEIQFELGGRMMYVECEDAPQLIDFYSRNGFYTFGKRSKDADEMDDMSGQYLIQLLKFIRRRT